MTVTGLQAGQYDTALDILDDEGSVNLDERAESWRSEGWGGYEASTYASRTGGTEPTMTGYEAAGLQTAREEYLAQRNGFRIQIREFTKPAGDARP